MQNYVNKKYDNVPKVINITANKITIECDATKWCVRPNALIRNEKNNKQWIWLAIDTKEIVGVYISSRNIEAAQGLWDSLPPVYQ